MYLAKPYLAFSDNKPGAASLLFKKAGEKNAKTLREKGPEEQREIQKKLADMRPLPQDMRSEIIDADGVACEWIERLYARQNKVIVYIHGGSWLKGDLQSTHSVGVLLAEYSACRVLAVDYRLAPEHPFPAALEDCYSVYTWLQRQGFAAKDIALFGDSAGGNLCLCLTHKLKMQDEELPCALGLASPVVEVGPGSALWLQKPDLIFIAMPDGEKDMFSLYAPPQQWKNPLISPMQGDLTGFPPMLIHVGGDEALSVDCTTFAAKAYEQGVDVLTKIWREMFHDFSIVGVTLKESRQSLSEMTGFLVKHLG